MYDQPLDGAAAREKLGRSDSMMAGFYIFHNAGIGLSCYAWGIFFGIGSLWTLASNAIMLGLIFGHMATTTQAGNFFTFVTAHGPFELTAIVFAGAAGLRLGSGLMFTEGQSRLASLRREGARSLPIAGVSVILFILAAFLEGFVSASPLPYWSKASIAAGQRLDPGVLPLRPRPRAAEGSGPRGRFPPLSPPRGDGVGDRTNAGADPGTVGWWTCSTWPWSWSAAGRGRWPWRALAGIAPFAALNAWLFGSIPDLGATLFPRTLWILEAPFATAPLTVVLGGLMFGQRPTAAKVVSSVARSAVAAPRRPRNLPVR